MVSVQLSFEENDRHHSCNYDDHASQHLIDRRSDHGKGNIHQSGCDHIKRSRNSEQQRIDVGF